MNNAYILGCSHAAGAEMVDGDNKSYPVKLAEQLNFNPVNLAISGGSNDAMFRIFEQHCDLNKIKTNDIVIACWTGSDRTEVVYHDSWAPIAPGIQYSPIDDYVKQWCVYDSDSWRWRLNKIKNIIALNEIARKIGVSVINFHSFNYIEGFKPYDIYTEYKWPCAEDTFTDWCLHNSFEHTEGGHFFEDAHNSFAQHALSALNTI